MSMIYSLLALALLGFVGHKTSGKVQVWAILGCTVVLFIMINIVAPHRTCSKAVSGYDSSGNYYCRAPSKNPRVWDEFKRYE